ncbi:MAG: hypothetical protein M3550_15830, partial [Actinomycetota bacterium]|nr:hypothetical protein [Actinomycetota bacterium]
MADVDLAAVDEQLPELGPGAVRETFHRRAPVVVGDGVPGDLVDPRTDRLRALEVTGVAKWKGASPGYVAATSLAAYSCGSPAD